ncbi:hypothetical protein DQ04_21081000 [Trypanosoma grayi]|uniref:hypothetical protein n=1 Tax=Trypanosoma grayi TaxID=71804 RepID=UPI0004F445E4|nr:hypothetical protein DQ04_21081000 [Trypanosoma grayi]KEG05515.1 hypothetical protein DQ04_21081000 [Trypanosoma grayi]
MEHHERTQILQVRTQRWEVHNPSVGSHSITNVEQRLGASAPVLHVSAVSLTVDLPGNGLQSGEVDDGVDLRVAHLKFPLPIESVENPGMRNDFVPYQPVSRRLHGMHSREERRHIGKQAAQNALGALNRASHVAGASV